MSRGYLCPVCKANRSRFELIYKLAQEIHKDAESGQTLYQGDELSVLVKSDGRPDLDVRCSACGYTGAEGSFARAAEREARAFIRH